MTKYTINSSDIEIQKTYIKVNGTIYQIENIKSININEDKRIGQAILIATSMCIIILTIYFAFSWSGLIFVFLSIFSLLWTTLVAFTILRILNKHKKYNLEMEQISGKRSFLISSHDLVLLNEIKQKIIQ